MTPTYRKGFGSRKDLAADPESAGAFAKAKAQIKDMDYRLVEESDPTRQCLLEIYASVVLKTPFNDFDTH